MSSVNEIRNLIWGGVASLVVGLCILAAPVVKTIQFKQNCSGYLKQAADANSVELCKLTLDKTIAYIEENDLTSGYTSVIYKTEDENVGFWYSNLKACQEELASIDEDATTLEKRNLLMKVRESLLDDGGESGTVITHPKGIQYYPDNLLWGLIRFVAVVFLTIFCVIFIFVIPIKMVIGVCSVG